ncbi:MAG: M24 family metallopeptidase [Burkholderiales bacterium]
MTTAAALPQRQPLPKQFCQLDRLLHAMKARNIDALVATSALDMYYLSGFAGIAHKADEPRPYAVIVSCHNPEHPIAVVADYYISTMLAQPNWIEDIRSFRSVMIPMDIAASPNDIDRFIPREFAQHTNRLRATHAHSLTAACQQALRDLKVADKTVAFDELRFGHQIMADQAMAVDAYDAFMFARAVKTPFEISKLKAATALNQQAITQVVNGWQKGMRWRELNHQYQVAAAQLGGFVRDPGGMVWGHPRGSDAAVTLDAGFDDFEILPGTNMMFDCHGTLDMYCWDGGKTWTVGGPASGERARLTQAVSNASEAVITAMKPGARISQLQTTGRKAFRQSGVPDPDSALIFFHGLGLSHMDIEQRKADGTANEDWMLEENMVVPLHILYPGDEQHRAWVEEIAQVTPAGGQPFFSWGFDPLTGADK